MRLNVVKTHHEQVTKLIEQAKSEIQDTTREALKKQDKEEKRIAGVLCPQEELVNIIKEQQRERQRSAETCINTGKHRGSGSFLCHERKDEVRGVEQAG